MYIIYYSNKITFLQALSTKLSPLQINLLNYLLHLQGRLPMVCASQSRMAAHVGCSRGTVNRHMKYFRQLGFLTMDRRFNDTSIYHLHHYFMQLKSQVSKIFSSLKYFSLTLLTYVYKWDFVTLSIIGRGFLSSGRSWREQHRQEMYDLSKKEDMDNPQVNGAVEKAVSVLNLTTWGALKLLIYDEKAIYYALDMLSRVSGMKKPFFYVKAKAEEYHRLHRLSVNHGLYNRLAKQYNAPLDPEWTEGSKIIPSTGKSDTVVQKNPPVLAGRPRSFLEQSRKIEQRLKEQYEANIAAVRSKYSQENANEDVCDRRQPDQPSQSSEQSPENVERTTTVSGKYDYRDASTAS